MCDDTESGTVDPTDTEQHKGPSVFNNLSVYIHKLELWIYPLIWLGLMSNPTFDI